MEEERKAAGAAATEPVAIAETPEAAEKETAMEEETEATDAMAEPMAEPMAVPIAEPMAEPLEKPMAEPIAEAGQGMLTPDGPEEDTYGVEAEAVRQVYPTFDLTHEMQDPVFRALVRGGARPTLRQVYELCHRDALTAEAVSAAVATAVAEAVSRAEAQLVSHIQARGQRPAENGMADRGAVRMHPDVGRLTRSDRARLAQRAQAGESIRL